MTDDRPPNEEETPEPSEEELERAEAEFFAEVAKDRPIPFAREVVRKEVLYAAPTEEDLLVSDLFPRTSPYLERGGRISHVLILWRGGRREPTHLLGWWAPYLLLRPEELAEAEYEADLEPLLVERGVEEGAVLAKEDFVIAPPEEDDRSLLGLEAGERVMYVVSEYRDRKGTPILLKRQIMVSGAVGRIRDLAWEKRHGGTDDFEY